MINDKQSISIMTINNDYKFLIYKEQSILNEEDRFIMKIFNDLDIELYQFLFSSIDIDIFLDNLYNLQRLDILQFYFSFKIDPKTLSMKTISIEVEDYLFTDFIIDLSKVTLTIFEYNDDIMNKRLTIDITHIIDNLIDAFLSLRYENDQFLK